MQTLSVNTAICCHRTPFVTFDAKEKVTCEQSLKCEEALIDWGLREVYSGCPVWTGPHCPVWIEDWRRCIQIVQCEQTLTVLYGLRTEGGIFRLSSVNRPSLSCTDWGLREVYSGCPVWTGPHCPVVIEDWGRCIQAVQCEQALTALYGLRTEGGVFRLSSVNRPSLSCMDWGLKEVYSDWPVWTGPHCLVWIEDWRSCIQTVQCEQGLTVLYWLRTEGGVFRLSSVNMPLLSCTDWGLREVYSGCPVWTGPHCPVVIEDWGRCIQAVQCEQALTALYGLRIEGGVFRLSSVNRPSLFCMDWGLKEVYSDCPVWTGPHCPVWIEDWRRCIQTVQCEQTLTVLYGLRTEGGILRLSSVNRPSLSCSDWGLREVYSDCPVWTCPHCPVMIEDWGRCIQAVQCEQALTVL